MSLAPTVHIRRLDIADGAVETGEQSATVFRYMVPESPVAGTTVDIGHVAITIELYLTGELDVTTRAAEGEPAGKRACALKALRGMARGLMVRGLGSRNPNIGSSAGTSFRQRRHNFGAPDKVTFAGECDIGYDRRCGATEVTVTGAVGYTLEVTARQTGTVVPAQTGTWSARHEGQLASIGMVVLVAAPIAPAGLVPVTVGPE